jgi:hypothetical protein
MAGGRPTNYKPEYCDLVVEHMSQGLSFETFGHVVKAHKQTLYEWTEKFQEFGDAKKRGELASQIFWERIGIAGTTGKLKNFNAASWIFNMRNRFGWRNDPDEVKMQPIKIEIVHPSDAN